MSPNEIPHTQRIGWDLDSALLSNISMVVLHLLETGSFHLPDAWTRHIALLVAR
jgi:hypothetical protein